MITQTMLRDALLNNKSVEIDGKKFMVVREESIMISDRDTIGPMQDYISMFPTFILERGETQYRTNVTIGGEYYVDPEFFIIERCGNK